MQSKGEETSWCVNQTIRHTFIWTENPKSKRGSEHNVTDNKTAVLYIWKGFTSVREFSEIQCWIWFDSCLICTLVLNHVTCTSLCQKSKEALIKTWASSALNSLLFSQGLQIMIYYTSIVCVIFISFYIGHERGSGTQFYGDALLCLVVDCCMVLVSLSPPSS